MDFQGVNLVINYDFPPSAVSLVVMPSYATTYYSPIGQQAYSGWCDFRGQKLHKPATNAIIVIKIHEKSAQPPWEPVFSPHQLSREGASSTISPKIMRAYSTISLSLPHYSPENLVLSLYRTIIQSFLHYFPGNLISKAPKLSISIINNSVLSTLIMLQISERSQRKAKMVSSVNQSIFPIFFISSKSMLV